MRHETPRSALALAEPTCLFRRRPREWLAGGSDPSENQRQFGKRREPEWRDAEAPIEVGSLAAAQAQHEIAFLVRRFRNERGLSNDEIARGIGFESCTVDRILTGTVYATLEQIYAIAAVLDLKFHTSIGIVREETAQPTHPRSHDR